MGQPSKFQRISRLVFVTASTSHTGGQPNFARCLDVSWAATLYIHFRDCCPMTEFRHVQSSLYVQVLRSPILATLVALLHGTPAAGISQTLWRGTRNGNIELSQRSRRHLYSAGRPSRWASAHILLVVVALCNRADHNIFIL